MPRVLVDTSVWVHHFRQNNGVLANLLELDQVLTHPLIIGEIACGAPPNRKQTLADLHDLRQAQRASVREVMDFIERERLFGTGCGLVDMLLLASTLMTPEAKLWTLDKKLRALAERFQAMYQPALH
ncbi:MAG: PIN domain-containing protein [Azonexus sp.]|jgi:predicted nucleic acid-binding protein|nr:PIN domain-containing protein [Azonexus sp.]